jgi:peptide/nickel transport system substrate-binding protein
VNTSRTSGIGLGMNSRRVTASGFNRRQLLAGAVGGGLAMSRFGSGSVRAQDEKQIVVAYAEDILANDPQRAFEFYSWVIVANTYDTLVTDTPENLIDPLPLLAKSWDIAPDGQTYTFQLDPSAKFASGNPVTAEDVKFSHQRLKNLKDVPGYYADPWVENITVIDEHTVQLGLNQPMAYLLPVLTVVPLSIADSKLIMEMGGNSDPDADQTDTAKEWLDQHSAGSGPYVLSQWTPKSGFILERNPNYWRTPPYFDRIIGKSVSDPTAQIQLVLSGDAQIAMDVDYDTADEFRDNPDIQIVEKPSVDLIYMALNTSPDVSAALANKQVRQAIQYGIDYDGIVNGLMRGHGVRPPSPIVLGMLGADPAMAVQRDVERAKQFLADSGMENVGFPLSYPTNPFGSVDPAVLAAKIQADLAEVGITVELRPVESSVFSSETLSGTLPAFVSLRGPDWPDASGWAEMFGQHGPEGGFISNHVNYDNPEVQRLVVEAGSIVDQQKREELYRQISQMFIDDAVYMPLIQPSRVYVGSPRLKGLTFHPLDIMRFDLLSY